MKKIIYLLILVSISCNSQKKIKNDLRYCVQSSVSDTENNIYGTTNIKFYDLMLKVENTLIKNRMLKDSKTESYLQLLKLNKENPLINHGLIEIDSILVDKKFDLRDTLLILKITKNCPYSVWKENDLNENSILYKQAYVVNELYESKKGFGDSKLLYEFILNTDQNDFDIIEYRSLVILLVLLNLNQ